MAVTRREIRGTLARYLERNPDEVASMAPLSRALDEARDVASRTEHLVGHVTVGAAVIDPFERVLMIRHRTLGTWLLPGGHLEPGDRDLLGASLRELTEETGVACRRAASPASHDGMPLDIDIHAIPANPAKQEPEHLHFDFRFVHRVEDPEIQLQRDEVTDAAWRPIAALPAGRLASELAALVAR